MFNAIIGLSENIESNISGTFAYSEIGAGSEAHTHKPFISIDFGSKECMSINIPEWMPFIGGSNIGMHINTQSYTVAISTKIQLSIPGIEGASLLGGEALVGGKEIVKLALEAGSRNSNKKDTIVGLYLGLPNSGIYTKDIYNSEFGSSYNWYSSGKTNTFYVAVFLLGVVNGKSLVSILISIVNKIFQGAAPAIVTLIIALFTQNSILETRSLEKNKECSNL